MDALRTAGSKAWAMVGIAVAVAIGVFVILLLKPLVVALLGALCVSLALSPGVDALARRGLRRGQDRIRPVRHRLSRPWHRRR